jgi:simple sugar transport system ATP-binding protein
MVPLGKSYRHIVKLENIQLNYGKVEALKNISFAVGPNEIVGLIGDNGAGKSSWPSARRYLVIVMILEELN